MSSRRKSSGRNSSLVDDDESRGADGNEDSGPARRTRAARKKRTAESNPSNSKEKSWKCPHCKKEFPPEMRDFHLATHGSGRVSRKHKCAKCGANYSNAQFRNLHEREEHGYDRRAAQSSGNSSGSSAPNVRACRHCGLLVAAGGLIVHERSHTRTSGHKCAKCGSFYSTKGNRDLHERTLHGFDRRVQPLPQEEAEVLQQQAEESVDQPVGRLTEESSVKSTSSSIPIVQAEVEASRVSSVQPPAPTTSKRTTLVEELRQKAVGLYIDMDHYPPNLAKSLADFWVREPSAELLVLRSDSPDVRQFPQLDAPACSFRMDRPPPKPSIALVFVKTPEMAERVRKEVNERMEFAVFASKLLPALQLPSVLLVASPADRASVDVQTLAAHRIFVFPQA